MPGTLRLILNLFDDLLDNFFIFFLFSSSNKSIQNHSSSDLGISKIFDQNDLGLGIWPL